MRTLGLLGALGMVACSAAATTASSATADIETTTDAGPSCVSATGIDANMTEVHADMFLDPSQPHAWVGDMTAATPDGTFTVSFPQGTFVTSAVSGTFPTTDVKVEYITQVDPTSFLSPTISFAATAGSFSCGPDNTLGYPCTFTDLVLTPEAGTDPSACASVAIPTFSVVAKPQQ